MEGFSKKGGRWHNQITHITQQSPAHHAVIHTCTCAQPGLHKANTDLATNQQANRPATQHACHRSLCAILCHIVASLLNAPVNKPSYQHTL